MSVPEPLRYKGRLKVHTRARELAVYTATILSNEKVFNPAVDRELIARIKNCAYDIFADSWSANKIRADSGTVNRIMRYNLQEEAILNCDKMLAYIGIAKGVYHLRSKRMKYWSGLILNVRALLQGWKESDATRYGQP